MSYILSFIRSLLVTTGHTQTTSADIDQSVHPGSLVLLRTVRYSLSTKRYFSHSNYYLPWLPFCWSFRILHMLKIVFKFFFYNSLILKKTDENLSQDIIFILYVFKEFEHLHKSTVYIDVFILLSILYTILTLKWLPRLAIEVNIVRTGKYQVYDIP
jgi:hypothetical protein